MYCQKCGTELVADARFCKECGSPIMESNKTEPIQEQVKVQKSRTLAGVLGILLGSYGIHNFYLGRTERGLAQLLLTLCAGGFTLTIFPIDYFMPFLTRYVHNEVTVGTLVCAWGIAEGIFILAKRTNTDTKGDPLKD